MKKDHCCPCNLNKELSNEILIHCGKTSIPSTISWMIPWLVKMVLISWQGVFWARRVKGSGEQPPCLGAYCMSGVTKSVRIEPLRLSCERVFSQIFVRGILQGHYPSFIYCLVRS